MNINCQNIGVMEVIKTKAVPAQTSFKVPLYEGTARITRL